MLRYLGMYVACLRHRVGWYSTRYGVYAGTVAGQFEGSKVASASTPYICICICMASHCSLPFLSVSSPLLSQVSPQATPVCPFKLQSRVPHSLTCRSRSPKLEGGNARPQRASLARQASDVLCVLCVLRVSASGPSHSLITTKGFRGSPRKSLSASALCVLLSSSSLKNVPIKA